MSVTPMTIEEIRKTLHEAARLRMPRFQNGNGAVPTRTKIEKLEDYLLATARWRSFLEEARLYAQGAVKDLKHKWDHMQGWEKHRRQGERTQTSIEDAKRLTNPTLYDSIQEGEWLVKRLSEQIRRLEHDDEVASRAYTFITGGS